MSGATRSQVVAVPEADKQEAGNVSCSLPHVVVLSAYAPWIPSDLAAQVPLTCREPVTCAKLQSKPRGARSN
jgi:hypothetical protein